MLTVPKSVRVLLLATSWLFLVLAVAAQTNSPASAAAPTLYRVSGTIVSKTDGHPLGRARITLREAKDARKYEGIITDDDGKFAFENVPAGKYSLTGEKRGFITASYDQHDQYSTAIVAGAGIATESLVLKLAPNAVIWGRVLDEAGEPVRHASVNLYYQDHQEGVDQIRSHGGDQTDDLGTYELPNLTPGTYFLSVTATPWYAVHPSSASGTKRDVAPDPSLDVAYPVIYYADVTNSDSATPIPIKGGERLQVDFHLNPVPSLHLLFHMPGDPQHGFTFPRFEQPAFDGSTFVQGRMSMTSPGVAEVSGIPAGQYNIRLQGQGLNAEMNGVDLTKDGQQIDFSSAEPLSTVKFKVQIAGESSIPKGLGVGLRSKRGIGPGFRMLDEKSEAEIQDVAPGRYEVFAFGGRKVYSVAHITADGAEVLGHSIALSPGASASATVTLIVGSEEINGVAQKAGKGFAGAMVVLVPKNPEGNRDLFRRDQSDMDGTFSLHNVVPGFYSLVAIENGWDLDWSQPAIIAAYAKHGRAIEVRDTGKSLDRIEPITVQSK